MMRIFLFCLCWCCSNLLAAQPTIYASTRATERQKLEGDLRQKIDNILQSPLDAQTESAWLEALWAMELMQIKSRKIAKALYKQVLFHYPHQNLEAQRQSLETVYGLYPHTFQKSIAQLIKVEKNPKLFAMMVHYLYRTKERKSIQALAQELLQKNLSNYTNHPIIFCLKQDLEKNRQQRLKERPPLEDLLQHPFPEMPWVFFSFQRLNRDFPGLTIIRHPDGQFERDSSGQLFQVPQLARAVSNLPGYLTNGNTPQGILSILEITTTDNQYIGPTEMLNMVLPYEVPLSTFYHQASVASNEENAYRQLLPLSWQSYFPIWEAYYAGKAGRTEIFAHGTTINPQFYAGAPYFPNTPSLGCLTASELWNPQTGQLEKSDQHRLIEKMQKLGVLRGYFVVVEIDDQNKAVSLEEIENLIK